jgi:hypothetical protein
MQMSMCGVDLCFYKSTMTLYFFQCNHCWVKLTVPCHPDRAECDLCGRYRTNPKNGGVSWPIVIEQSVAALPVGD